MQNNKIDSLKLLKKSMSIYNDLHKKIKKVITNSALYNYIIDKLNNIEIKYIKISDSSIEIKNETEKFSLSFIYDKDIIKRVIILYDTTNRKVSKEILFEDDLIKLKENDLIDRNYEIQNYFCTKTYENNLLIRKHTLNKKTYKYNQYKTTIEENEAYFNNETILAKKTFVETNGNTKTTYYINNGVANLYFADKNSSDEVYDEFIFMNMEKTQCTKEEFIIACKEWENTIKKEQRKTLSKKSKNNYNKKY